MKLILASTSIFRQQQLTELGYSFSSIAPLFDEDKFKSSSLSFEDLCLMLGEKKAMSLADDNPDAIIIGSDQMLICDEQMFNKPKTKNEVIERLTHLQGRKHSLFTSLFIYSSNKNYTHLDKTHLTMKTLTPDQVIEYAELDQPLGCAGGYKYELNGKNLFESVDSQDPSSIIGLPTLALKDIINEIKGS